MADMYQGSTCIWLGRAAAGKKDVQFGLERGPEMEKGCENCMSCVHCSCHGNPSAVSSPC